MDSLAFWLLLPALALSGPGRPAGTPQQGLAQDGAAGPRAGTPCPPGLEVLVERGFASERGLGPGDTLAIRPRTGASACAARVAGIFEPRADPATLTRDRPRILFHLPQLAAFTGRPDEVDRFSVRLRSGADTAAAAERLAGYLPGARVLPTAEVARRSSTTFEVVRRFHRAIALITLVAGAVFLACIMVLKVQERRGPVAALRLIGVSRRTLFAWILAEAALVSVVGGALGVGIGKAASAVINRYYRGVYGTGLTFSLVTPGTVEQALVLAVGLGLAAGAAAALHLLSRDPLLEVGR